MVRGFFAHQRRGGARAARAGAAAKQRATGAADDECERAGKERDEMIANESQDLVDVLRHDGRRFDASRTEGLFDPLMKMIGEARFVLIGEASHGTHEFYDTRAALTRRLIQEKGFNAVVAEADWPDAYRVKHCVRGFDDDQ